MSTQDEEICKVTDDTSSVYRRSATRSANVQSAFLARNLNYSDYLQLDKVLDAQVNKSLKTFEPRKIQLKACMPDYAEW